MWGTKVLALLKRGQKNVSRPFKWGAHKVLPCLGVGDKMFQTHDFPCLSPIPKWIALVGVVQGRGSSVYLLCFTNSPSQRALIIRYLLHGVKKGDSPFQIIEVSW